jgi:hypothetical protein
MYCGHGAAAPHLAAAALYHGELFFFPLAQPLLIIMRAS